MRLLKLDLPQPTGPDHQTFRVCIAPFLVGWLAGQCGTVGVLLFVAGIGILCWPDLKWLYDDVQRSKSRNAQADHN